MKTITEFSGILLQRAAEAQRAFRAEHPQTETRPADTAPAEAPGAEETPTGAEEAPAGAEAAPSEAGAAAEVAETENAASDSAAPATDSPPADEVAAEAAVEPSLGEGPEAEAVGAAMQVEGDRLARLMEALDVAGRRVGQVRLVRVIQGENAPQGAQKRGEFYYVVDLMPRPQSQRESFDGRRGPGGRDRGGRPGDRGHGGPRGPGAGGGGPGGSRGKFSNDRPGGRDGEREARGEMPRGGAGWTLTRAPEDRRDRGEQGGAPNRDRPGDRRFPTRGPRDANRGPRPPMGDRPPRGPRPDGTRAGGRFDGGGPRPGGDRPQGVGPNFDARGPGRGPRPPRRPEGGNGGGQGGGERWGGRRRGGWDEPAVADAAETAAPTAAPAAPVVENSPAAAPAPVEAAQSQPNPAPSSEDVS